jgi:hypothetical protein
MTCEILVFFAVMSQSVIAKKGGVEPSQGVVLCSAQLSVIGDEEDEIMSSSRVK